MEIEKWQSANFGEFIKFKEDLGTPCNLSVEDERLKFIIHEDKFLPEYATFTQEDIKLLLPYLQAFVETGRLELPPQRIPLQGAQIWR